MLRKKRFVRDYYQEAHGLQQIMIEKEEYTETICKLHIQFLSIRSGVTA